MSRPLAAGKLHHQKLQEYCPKLAPSKQTASWNIINQQIFVNYVTGLVDAKDDSGNPFTDTSK